MRLGYGASPEVYRSLEGVHLAFEEARYLSVACKMVYSLLS